MTKLYLAFQKEVELKKFEVAIKGVGAGMGECYISSYLHIDHTVNYCSKISKCSGLT